MLYFDEKKYAESVENFESVFSATGPEAESMTPRESSMARFFLGAAYGQSGNMIKAKANLQLALQIDPTNTQARQMLSALP